VLRRALLAYQLKLSTLRTLRTQQKQPSTVSADVQCRFSFSEQMHLAHTWRNTVDIAGLSDILKLTTSQNQPITADSYQIIPYQAFLDNHTGLQKTRSLDITRDLAMQYNFDLYEKFLLYKMRETLLLYLSIQQVLEKDGLKQVAEFFLENNYKKDIENLYKGLGGAGDMSSGEPAQAAPVAASPEAEGMIGPSPSQSGDSGAKVDAE